MAAGCRDLVGVDAGELGLWIRLAPISVAVRAAACCPRTRNDMNPTDYAAWPLTMAAVAIVACRRQIV